MVVLPSAAPRTSSRWTLVLTSAAFFMVTLDALVVITALTAIHRDFGASLATLQWTVNAYTLAFAAGITTAAALGDRFGRRRIFIAGLLVFSAASAACAVSPTIETLVAARVLQGAAAAMVMPISLTILTAAFPPERRGAVVGIWGGVAGLAVASGPFIGGALTEALSWHWVFWVNVPIGIGVAALSALRLRESFGAPTRLDLTAVALVSGGALGIVLGLVDAGNQGWSSPATIFTLGLGVVLMAGFVAWELRAEQPMLPMRLFRNLAFSSANATGFFMSGSQFAAAFLIAQYFQLALHNSPLQAGLRVLPWTATPLVVAPVAGALSDRIGRRPLMAAGMVLQGVGFLWFAALVGSGTGYWASITPLVIAGIGVSMVLPVTPAAVVSAVSPHDMGKASGVNSTLQRFGSAFGVATVTAVFAASGSLADAAAFTSGMQPALAAAALLSLFGAITALGVTRPRLAAVPVAAPVEPEFVSVAREAA
ncbi:MAG: DHA2 family efflux MFS transporter permease subunit [Chloroflexi bacterium]|nr:DHA2 family efflux MFS transporter permease subunit [Chloroflexota bacterium]